MPLRLLAPNGRAVADDVRIARSARERSRGLLGFPELGERQALLLRPAKQIHTFGMRYRIDAVFCGRRGRVLRVVRSLRPHRMTRPVIRSRFVLEMRAGGAEGLVEGDALMLVQGSADESER